MRRVSWVFALWVALPCVLAAGACTSSNSSSHASPLPIYDGAPLAAGATGAFGIVTVGGKQKMYLPQVTTSLDVDSGAENGVISVVDVAAVNAADASLADSGAGAPVVPALITNILLPNAGPDAGLSLAGVEVASATGGDSANVVAVSSSSPSVWFIDPTVDQVVGSLELDSTYGQASFSGGEAYITGVAVDSPHNRAILGVWNGFVIVDLTTRTIAATISAPPSENFGYDSLAQRIYAPFYECTLSANSAGSIPASCNNPKGPDGVTVMTDGLSVIDLSDPSFPVYTYENPDVDDAGLVSDPNEPLGGEPDSAAVDPTTGLVVIPSESDGFQSVLDMSSATFDKTTMTVTAPRQILDTSAVDCLDAVAIEPNSHIALWEAEFDPQIAAADLTLANVENGVWAYATMPALPGNTGFLNIGDPHGLAVTTALIGGAPVGFVVDQSLRWIGRINFEQIAQQAAAINESIDLDVDAGPDAAVGQSGISPYVTYLDAITLE